MLIITLKILVPAFIISVWCFRQKRKTPFRAGEATSLQEEFAYYGLSREMFYVAGLIKISLAIMLFASVWFDQLTIASALGLSIMMLSAFLCHIKVRDKMFRTVPSLIIFALSLTLLCFG